MENCCDRDVSFSFVFFFIRVTFCEKNRWIRYNKIWRKNSVYLKIPTNFPANLPCILSNLSNDRSRKYLISLKNRFILAFNQNSSRVTSTTTFDFIKTIRITEFRERSVPINFPISAALLRIQKGKKKLVDRAPLDQTVFTFGKKRVEYYEIAYFIVNHPIPFFLFNNFIVFFLVLSKDREEKKSQKINYYRHHSEKNK